MAPPPMGPVAIAPPPVCMSDMVTAVESSQHTTHCTKGPKRVLEAKLVAAASDPLGAPGARGSAPKSKVAKPKWQTALWNKFERAV
eukprot:6784083-Pyramimonas_sp.AAC.1